MVSINLVARGFGNNRNMLDLLTARGDELRGEIFHQLGLDIVVDAKFNLLNNQNIATGVLVDSIKIIDEIPGKQMIVGSTANHAIYIEFGRGPIRPVKAKVLHFITKEGVEVFTTFAKATNPMPFLQPAVTKNTKKFSDVYVQIHEDIVNREVAQILDSELL